MKPRLPLPEAGFTLAALSLAGCNQAHGNWDGLETALVTLFVIVLSVLAVVAVVFVMNIVVAVTGRTGAGWGKAGLVLGILALLLALLSFGSDPGDEYAVLFSVCALLVGVPLCALGWRNMKTAKPDAP